MTKRITNGTEPIFTVTLDRGMADRNRMPFADVIKFLNELKNLIVETGKQIERDRGIDPPVGDYGLEILADGNGRFLAKGSVKASVAITRNIEVGAMAVSTVLSTLRSLNTPRKGPIRETRLQAAVVHRLDRLAFINTYAKVDAKFSFVRPASLQVEGKRPTTKATLDSHTIQSIREFRPRPVFTEEGITLFGKLFHLRDKAHDLEDETAGFWGELRLDNGNSWRVQFPKSLETETAPLFRRQVAVTGIAHYYEKRNPKLIATSVIEDGRRDYEAAFDELAGTEPHLLDGKTIDQLIAE